MTSDRPEDMPKHLQQELLKNIQVQGNLTTGDITQIGSQFFLNLDKSAKPTSIPQNLPCSGVSNFVGREETIATLHQQLQQRERVAISAIAGMGGVGKTELALQYAHLQWQQQTYPGGVCWVMAREVDLGTQILTFARVHLQLHPPEDLDLPSQVAFCWRHWLPGEVLLVLDDVTGYQKVKPYLDLLPSSRFKVLITTRLQLGSSIEQLSLDVLKPRAALALLESLIGRERLKQEPWIARKLCKWLGYLPLGLELVGRYLRRKPDLCLDEILSRLKAKRLEQLSLKKPKSEADMTAQWGVQDAFELSWQELDEQAKLLGLCLSLFALAPISWQLVEQCLPALDPEELEETRDYGLVNLHLVQRKGDKTYQLHQLIRAFFSAKREQSALADELKRGFCQVMVTVAKQIPQIPTIEAIAAVNSTIPHLAEAAIAQQDWLRNEDLISPFVGLSRFYQGQGAYQQAAHWLDQCLSITRNRLGEDALDVAITLNNLALLYKSQGKYNQAEDFYLQALALFKQLLGEEHPHVATCLNNFANLNEFLGRYDQAERLHIQALALRKQLLGEEHPAVAQSLNNLALLYESQGKYNQAEDFYLQALTLYKRLLGEEHPDVAQSLNNLAALYQSLGRYDQAEPLYRQALELRKRLLGEEHIDVAQSLNNLALFYKSQGRYDQAEPLYRQALTLYKRLLGEEHPDIAQSLNNLAALYESQGKYDQAERLHIQALELRKRLLGEEHPDIAQSLNNLAALYESQGKYDQAERLHIQALELRKRLLGEEHPAVAQSLNNLAAVYESQDRYDEAELFYCQASEIAERKLGINHPWTVQFRKNFKRLEVKYQEKVQQYEQEFSKVIQQQYFLTPETRDELQRFQEKLNLREKDIVPIEKRIKAQIDSAHIKEIRSAIGGRLIQDYRQLARIIIQQMGATAPALIESPKFEIGTVWEVLLPLVGLRLRTQKAVLFLRQREESNNIHEYLAEIAFDKNAAFLIVVDLVDIRRPPIEVGSPTIWFRPESLIEMATTPENELLGWLGRFITTQIDICALPGLLPYQITGAAKELFFGRDYELTRLIGGTLRGGIIVGAHRSGKTSLLHQLGKRLEQRDCQVVGVLTLGGIESFQSFFERTLEPLDIDFPEQMTPASWASALRAYGKNNQSPVFLLDEVDDLIRLDTQSEFTLGKQMRSLQSDGQCEFYLAGHAKLRQAIEVEGGPFRNFAEEITLTGLTETASMRLIQQPMKLIGFEVTDDQARQIYEGTAGVAVLIQEFCIRLLRGLRQVNTSHIEDAEIKKIEKSPEYLSVVFEHYKYAQEWDSLVILLLTTILEEVKKRDIIKELSKQGASLTGSRLDKILEFLVRFGVLEEFKVGEYRVLPGYLCRAIQARDPELLLESALEQGGVSKFQSESEKATHKKGMEWLVAKAKSFFTN